MCQFRFHAQPAKIWTVRYTTLQRVKLCASDCGVKWVGVHSQFRVWLFKEGLDEKDAHKFTHDCDNRTRPPRQQMSATGEAAGWGWGPGGGRGRRRRSDYGAHRLTPARLRRISRLRSAGLRPWVLLRASRPVYDPGGWSSGIPGIRCRCVPTMRLQPMPPFVACRLSREVENFARLVAKSVASILAV